MSALKALSEAREWESFVISEWAAGRAAHADTIEAREARMDAQVAFQVSLGHFAEAERILNQKVQEQEMRAEDALVAEIVGAISRAIGENPDRVANGDTLAVHVDR